jgi:hypothetical protein
MDGQELVRRALLLRPRLRIVCMTGNPEDVTLGPRVILLEKPFTLKDLVEAARRTNLGAHSVGPTTCRRRIQGQQ